MQKGLGSLGQTTKKRAVRDMHTGERWESVTALSRELDVTQGALRIQIRAHRPCQGRWFIYEDDMSSLCTCCKARLEAA